MPGFDGNRQFVIEHNIVGLSANDYTWKTDRSARYRWNNRKKITRLSKQGRDPFTNVSVV